MILQGGCFVTLRVPRNDNLINLEIISGSLRLRVRRRRIAVKKINENLRKNQRKSARTGRMNGGCFVVPIAIGTPFMKNQGKVKESKRKVNELSWKLRGDLERT
jgi:hypothetical protein